MRNTFRPAQHAVDKLFAQTTLKYTCSCTYAKQNAYCVGALYTQKSIIREFIRYIICWIHIHTTLSYSISNLFSS